MELFDEEGGFWAALYDYADELAAGLGMVAFMFVVDAIKDTGLLPDFGTAGLINTNDAVPVIGDILPSEIMFLSSGTAETVTITYVVLIAFLAPLWILGTNGLQEMVAMVSDDDAILDRPFSFLSGLVALVLPVAYIMFDVLNSAAAGSPTIQVLMVVLYAAAVTVPARADEL